MILRQIVAPLLGSFLFCASVVIVAARSPAPPPPRPSRLSRANLRPFLRYLAVLEVGGSVALLAVVLVFSVLIVGDTGALRSAVWSAAFLLAVATPVFALLSWAHGRWRRR